MGVLIFMELNGKTEFPEEIKGGNRDGRIPE